MNHPISTSERPPRRRRPNQEAIKAKRGPPQDDPEKGDVLCCRAQHPAKHKPEYAGRIHGVRFPVSLPEGYVARFTGRVLNAIEEKDQGRAAFQCASSDCRKVTEYEITLAPELAERFHAELQERV